MIHKRGRGGSIIASPTDEDIAVIQTKIISVEAQAAALAQSMQRVHGGKWTHAYDEDVAAVFIFQVFD